MKNIGRIIIYLLKFLSQNFKNDNLLFFKVPPTQASNCHNKENTISILTWKKSIFSKNCYLGQDTEVTLSSFQRMQNECRFREHSAISYDRQDRALR